MRISVIPTDDERLDIICTVNIEKVERYCIEGHLVEHSAWESEDKKSDLERVCHEYDSFFASFSIKWDACSHFGFYGEDHLKEGGETDSYYHVCGSDSYFSHIRNMWIIWHVADMHFSKTEHYDYGFGDEKEDSMKEFDRLFEGRYIFRTEPD